MKYIASSPSEMPYLLVNFGVDTLVLNVRYADDQGEPLHSELTEEQITQLNEWQSQAKEAEEPVPVPLSFHGANLLMHPHGAGKGQWRWLLTNEHFNLCISRGRLNGVIAQVRLSSALLWSAENTETHEQDIWPLLAQIEAFLTSLFKVGKLTRLHLQVSEIHLCADVAGWDVSHAFDWQATMLTRARRRLERGSFAPPEPDDCAANGCAGAAPAGSFLWQGPDNEVPVPICHGHHLETLEFGSHGSPLSCSIYNKSRELLKSGKTWLIPLWCARGYDQQTDVWRIEFRWKREALHNLKQEGVFHGIESLADLRAYLPYLWTYSAGHVQGGVDGLPDGWLRYTSPTDDNTPSRWPVHPAWSVVQSAFTTETEPAVNVDTGELVDLPLSLPLAELIRERQRQRNEKRLAQQIGGCCSTLAAWLTSRSATEPVTLVDVFLWLEENLPAYASPDLMKQAEEEGIPLEELRTLLDMRFDAAFSETVLDKQVLYGRRTLSER